jgi:hypothetical protein
MSTATSVDDFLQALVAKRLYDELAGFENKLRNSQTYWVCR